AAFAAQPFLPRLGVGHGVGVVRAVLEVPLGFGRVLLLREPAPDVQLVARPAAEPDAPVAGRLVTLDPDDLRALDRLQVPFAGGDSDDGVAPCHREASEASRAACAAMDGM